MNIDPKVCRKCGSSNTVMLFSFYTCNVCEPPNGVVAQTKQKYMKLWAFVPRGLLVFGSRGSPIVCRKTKQEAREDADNMNQTCEVFVEVWMNFSPDDEERYKDMLLAGPRATEAEALEQGTFFNACWPV